MFVGLSLFTIRLSFLPDRNSYAHARINYEKDLYCQFFAETYPREFERNTYYTQYTTPRFIFHTEPLKSSNDFLRHTIQHQHLQSFYLWLLMLFDNYYLMWQLDSFVDFSFDTVLYAIKIVASFYRYRCIHWDVVGYLYYMCLLEITWNFCQELAVLDNSCQLLQI